MARMAILALMGLAACHAARPSVADLPPVPDYPEDYDFYVAHPVYIEYIAPMIEAARWNGWHLHHWEMIEGSPQRYILMFQRPVYRIPGAAAP